MATTTDVADLVVQSLQLDVQCLQKYREKDKHEFSDFRDQVNANFDNLQRSLGNIQLNFEKLFAAKGNEHSETPLEEQ